MPYLVRYAGERFGKYRPITRERIIADLRMWMCPKEVCNTILRIAKGQKVRTRAATYCYTEEPRPTEEEYRERLRDAVSNRTPTFGTRGTFGAKHIYARIRAVQRGLTEAC